jgi:hypothetical protein
MSSVGPQLPPHLQKRKRSPSSSQDPSSPPAKVIVATAPRAAGPALPPLHNPEELALDESSDDDYGPSIPHAQTTKQASPPPKRRVLGPAPPPAPLSEKPPHAANPSHSDEDSSDDDYGPSLPPPPGSHAESQLNQARALSEERRLSSTTSSTAAPKPQRAEWMLVPPSDSDWTTRVDPTKLKSRKFASGKGAKAPAEKGGISAIWTETPEEKRQRLEDEVLGRKDAATSTTKSKKTGGGGESRDREEEATAKRIREYNERNRNRSLYEEHEGKAGVKEKEDDPSKRGFDREKDMALGGRLGHGEKREMLAKARDFGSRFERGKFL